MKGKWRPDGPARTNTGISIRGKISAPIPMADDDEFPIRLPGATMATPLEGVNRQLNPRGTSANGRPRSGFNNDASSPLPVNVSPNEITVPPVRRTNQPSAERNSGISVSATVEDSPPPRKKSSLRSALGRIFGGKKRKSIASQLNGPGDDVRGGQHRSDPTALNRSPQNSNLSQKRSASLPINEFNRALRSHSIGPDSLLLLDQPTEQTDGETTLVDPRSRPRRATTPSRLYTPTKGPGYADWTGLSPRPVSSYARGSKVFEDDDEELIGQAVTKGSHPNRRSRSLGHLRGVYGAENTPRRRSDEIRYWRGSYDPGALSPMSSNKPEDLEPISMDQPEIPQSIGPQEEPQPFNFGPIGEMAGMKITQAASWDTRVSSVESRLAQVEKTIFQMLNRTQMGHVQLQDPPKRNSRQDQSEAVITSTSQGDEEDLPLPKQAIQNRVMYNSTIRPASIGSSRPSTGSTSNSCHPSYTNDEGSSPPSFLSSAPNTSFADAPAGGRPLSTSTTIRALPSSSPTMPKEKGGSLTADHYTALMNMILAEQLARESLETLVRGLQQQLVQQSSRQKIPSHRRPSSDQLRDPLEPVNGNLGRAHEAVFSTFEQGESSDDEGRDSNENFLTPKEEQGPFSSEDDFGVRNGGDVKSPPRTMSLSQMTMKASNGNGIIHAGYF